MRNLKRVLSLALALVMVLGMMVITTSAATFDDADEITNVEAVELMNALGIVQGDGTGNFNPDGTFTRAAAAKLLTLMLVKPAVANKLGGACAFDDVNNDPAYAWAAPYVAYCNNLQYIVGVGNGKFNPGGELTDIELGKLVLCALGYDAAKYTGDNWATAVTLDLIEAGLVTSVTGTVISREDACQMILDAMKWSAAPTAYQVVKDGKAVYSSEDILQAYLYAEILGGKVEIAEPQDTLLQKVYGVKFDSDAVDAFGRSIRTYTNAATKLNLSYANEEPVDASKLTGYTVATKELDEKVSVENIVYVNGADAVALVPAAGKTLADAIKALDTDTAEVEIYADGKNIYKIVVVQYTYDVVVDVTEATKDAKATVEFANAGVVEMTGYEKGDYVAYVEIGGKLTDMVKLETYAGVMTSYTNTGKYTIGGETFESEGTDFSGLLGDKNIVYVLGLTGKLVDAYVDAGDGKPAEVIKNYVLITDSLGKVTTSKDDWTGAVTTTGATAQVKGILSDGTVGVWNLVVKQDSKTKAFYVEVDGNKVAVAAGDLDINGFYTYKMTEDGIVLVSSDVPAYVNQTKVDEKTLAVDGAYLITADTTFIVIDAKNKVSVVDSMDDIYANAGDAVVFYDIQYNTDKDGNKTEAARVATVVYAYVESVVEPAEVVDVVYIDGSYTASVVDDKTVYAYEGATLKGEVVALTSDKVLSAGIYEYDEKNVVGAPVAGTADKVVAVLGSVVNLETAGYMTVADGVEPVVVNSKASWGVGASIVYFVEKGAISGIYVVG